MSELDRSLAGYWAKYPRALGSNGVGSGRPVTPAHSATDYEGNYRELSPEQHEQNAHAEAAANEFDANAQARREASQGKGSSSVLSVLDEAKRKAQEVLANRPADDPELAPVRESRGRGTGNQVIPNPDALKPKQLGMHIARLHKQLKSIASTLQVHSDPSVRELAGEALKHLDGYTGTAQDLGLNDSDVENNKHLQAAIRSLDIVGARTHLTHGDIALGSRQVAIAGTSYRQAANQISKAVKILGHPYIQHNPLLGLTNVELPSLNDMKMGVDNLPRLLPGNRPTDKTGKIPFAGKTIGIDSEEARRIDKQGREAAGDDPRLLAAAKKVSDARKATPRTNKLARTLEGVDKKTQKFKRVRQPASEKTVDLSIRTDANNNVPKIMGKPEIGPDIGSNVPPRLPNTRGRRTSEFNNGAGKPTGEQNNQGEERH